MSGHWDESKLKRRIKELGAKNKRLAECEEVASRFNADLKAENKLLREALRVFISAVEPDCGYSKARYNAVEHGKKLLETDDEKETSL